MSTETTVMTPEEQRMAIAQICGWKRFPWQDGILVPESMRVLWVEPGHFHYSNQEEYLDMVAHSHPCNGLPDYLNDLDAMHEAERIYLTTDARRDLYSDLLMKCMDDVFPLWFASASERAKAMCLMP